MTQRISSRAGLLSGTLASSGHGASISIEARGLAAVRAHNSSVMNGMKGCSSLTIWSRTQAAVARVSALAASSVPFSTGLMNSRYQSQKTAQTK